MGIGRLLSYTDTGAPQLQGTVGSLATILKAALVDGYGSVAPLGWTLEYSSDSYKVCAFRNNPVTGTGFYFKINDNYTTSPRHAPYYAYEQMTAVDSYVNPLLASESSPNWFYKSYFTTVQDSSIPWWIVGDDKGIWLITQPRYHGGTYATMSMYHFWYVGDYNPADPSNVYRFCFVAGNSLAAVSAAPSVTYPYSPLTATSPGTTSNRIRLMRASTGAVGSVDGGISLSSLACGSDAEDYSPGFKFGATSGDGPINGVVFLGNPIMLHHDGKLIGSLPGFYDPLLNSINTNTQYVYYIVQDGAKTFLIFPVYYDNSSLRGHHAVVAGPGFRDDI